jgi:hypothetical protein
MNIKKSHIIIGLIIGSLLIVLSWFFLRPQGVVEFRVAPEQLTLTLNGKPQLITNGQRLALKPGTYSATFTRDGFGDEKKNIVIKNHETTKFTIALTPETDAARKLINDNPESVKITAEYKAIKVSDLAAKMPIKAASFSIKNCPSIKHPGEKNKAFCITLLNANSERIARLYLNEQGYNPDELELLTGTSNLMTLQKTASYKVETYITDTADKPSLYITPLNVPYVDSSVPYNAQLEGIRATSLADLKKEGYDLDKYTIVFSNIYLSKYNADHVHDGAGHSLE